MTRIRLAAVSLLLVSALCGARADEQKGAETPLGPGDIIEITVENHPDLNRKLPIPPDGNIQLPEVGEVKVAGKSARALAAELQKKVDKVRNNAVVTVQVDEIHSRRIRILGSAVKSPGEFDLRANWRLFDVLAAAGDLTAKPVDVSARILRGSKVLDVDIEKAKKDPLSAANIALQPDDVVLIDVIDRPKRFVYVRGQVAKPGTIVELSDDTTISLLLDAAGQPLPTASLSHAYVLRKGKEVPLSLSSLVSGQPDDKVRSFKLEPGDELTIPEVTARYAVMGEMLRQGWFAIPERGPVITALQAYLAAGPGTRPDPRKASIIRTVDGKTTQIRIDLDRIPKKGDISKDVALQSGDILYVPERGHAGPTLGSLFGLATSLRYLGLLPLL